LNHRFFDGPIYRLSPPNKTLPRDDRSTAQESERTTERFLPQKQLSSKHRDALHQTDIDPANHGRKPCHSPHKEKVPSRNLEAFLDEIQEESSNLNQRNGKWVDNGPLRSEIASRGRNVQRDPQGSANRQHSPLRRFESNGRSRDYRSREFISEDPEQLSEISTADNKQSRLNRRRPSRVMAQEPSHDFQQCNPSADFISGEKEAVFNRYDTDTSRDKRDLPRGNAERNCDEGLRSALGKLDDFMQRNKRYDRLLAPNKENYHCEEARAGSDSYKLRTQRNSGFQRLFV
jgi:hypothetical protein